MKKNWIYLVVFLLLLAVAAWLVTRDKNTTFDPAEVSFQVADTAALSKIFIADRKGNAVTLERQPDSSWMVNGKYKARPDMVKVLLETLSRMEVKMPVPKGAMNNVMANLASAGIKVEVYKGADQQKELVFYVGSSTTDTRGTYMIKEDAEIPYILYLPGWEGYLTPRFFASEEEWRERILFRLNPNEIASFEVSYPDSPGKGYFIAFEGDTLYTISRSPAAPKTFLQAAAGYSIWTEFANFRVEGFENQVPIRDSVIRMVPPIMHATITERSGKKHTITTYFKSQVSTIDVVLLQGYPDLDRHYFYYREGNDFGVLQDLIQPWMYLSYDEMIRRSKR